MEAADFLRQLYREELLSDAELADRIQTIRRLQDGDIRPELTDTAT